MNNLVENGSPDVARQQLVDRLRARGRITRPEVAAAFLAVPRHEFAPAGTSLRAAYADDVVVTKRDCRKDLQLYLRALAFPVNSGRVALARRWRWSARIVCHSLCPDGFGRRGVCGQIGRSLPPPGMVLLTQQRQSRRPVGGAGGRDC